MMRKIKKNAETNPLASLADPAGNADRGGLDANFDFPTGLPPDALGKTYTADQANHPIRKIRPDSNVSAFVGLPSATGAGCFSHFLRPRRRTSYDRSIQYNRKQP